MYYGLTTQDVRLLAYEYAVAYNVLVPKWAETGRASADWFSGFMQRHRRLSIRTPEATTVSRATSFNRHNVGKFFDNLSSVYERFGFECQSVYNVDKTGVQTVQKPTKVVATKGAKQVGTVTSGERGVTVTMAIAINAVGNSIPSIFIFPRKNCKDHFINGGPPGCIGVCHKSGWMTGENFLVFMKHFVKHVHCT